MITALGKLVSADPPDPNELFRRLGSFSRLGILVSLDLRRGHRLVLNLALDLGLQRIVVLVHLLSLDLHGWTVGEYGLVLGFRQRRSVYRRLLVVVDLSRQTLDGRAHAVRLRVTIVAALQNAAHVCVVIVVVRTARRVGFVMDWSRHGTVAVLGVSVRMRRFHWSKSEMFFDLW